MSVGNYTRPCAWTLPRKCADISADQKDMLDLDRLVVVHGCMIAPRWSLAGGVGVGLPPGAFEAKLNLQLDWHGIAIKRYCSRQ